MKRVYLETGHLTDEELGFDRELDRQMKGLPCPANERVSTIKTRNGNVITRRSR